MVRPCHRICTSMSSEHVSSGAMPRTSTDSPFRSGEFALEAMHFAWNGKLDLIFQIVVPAHGLLLGPIGIHDDFLVDALLSDGIALRFCHGSL